MILAGLALLLLSAAKKPAPAVPRVTRSSVANGYVVTSGGLVQAGRSGGPSILAKFMANGFVKEALRVCLIGALLAFGGWLTMLATQRLSGTGLDQVIANPNQVRQPRPGGSIPLGPTSSVYGNTIPQYQQQPRYADEYEG